MDRQISKAYDFFSFFYTSKRRANVQASFLMGMCDVGRDCHSYSRKITACFLIFSSLPCWWNGCLSFHSYPFSPSRDTSESCNPTCGGLETPACSSGVAGKGSRNLGRFTGLHRPLWRERCRFVNSPVGKKRADADPHLEGTLVSSK